MLDSTGKININTVRDYQTSIIKGVTKKLEYYSLSNLKTLPIRYLKQQESNNYDSETNIKHEHKNSKFVEYHFLPVVDSQMISPTVMYDDTKQGMNFTSIGELIIMTVDKPLPGDYFNYYIDAHKVIQEKELFKITDATFIRTAMGLNLYRINFETANISIDYPYIEKSYFWNQEFRQIYSMDKILYYKILSDRKYLPIINKYYRKEWSIVYDKTLTKEENASLNMTLSWIKNKSLTNNTGLPLIVINNFNPSKVKLPTLDIKETNDGMIYPLKREIVWKEIPNYVNINLTDPNYSWSWLDGKVPNELAFEIWRLYWIYLVFLNENDPNDAKFKDQIMSETNLISEYINRQKINVDNYNHLIDNNKGYSKDEDN